MSTGRDRSATAGSFATRRPVGVFMVFLAAVVFGVFSCARLPVTLMPELTYPTITVRTQYPGAAPEEVENDVSRPIEEALGVIGGLRRISSISRAGLSDVVLELAWDADVSQATQDTLERLDLVLLPDEAEKPLILHYDPSLDPVMELSLSAAGPESSLSALRLLDIGTTMPASPRLARDARMPAARRAEMSPQGLRRLRRIAELQVRRALEPIKGVAAVRVRGGLEEEIHVLLDEEKLRATGLSIGAVIERLRQENVNVAGGTIEEGATEYMVRTLNEYQNLGQIADTIITSEGGRDVRVRDLGRVVRSNKDREIVTETDGHESVQIDVYKEADANIVALADRVKAALGSIPAAEGDAPAEAARGAEPAKGAKPAGLAQALYDQEGVRLSVVADRSVFIRGSIADVKSAAVVGGLLAVAVLFLFLANVRSTLIIALAIPVSLAVTFAPLHLLGVSLNIMSLGGLALGIGMLVDSSIVVLESIFRCREEGDDVAGAAVRGTGEVRGAVTASTLTTIAVFFPMVFVEGIAGQAFGDLGLAVVISLLASLVVALFLIPMLASRRGVDLARLSRGEGVELRRLRSLEVARRDLDRGHWWSKVLVAPYALVRLAIGLVLELVGKLLLVLVMGLTWIWVRAGRPAGRGLGLLLRPLLRGAERAMSAAQGAYPRLARAALAHAGWVVAATLAILAVTVYLFSGLGTELLHEVHQGEVTFELALPVDRKSTRLNSSHSGESRMPSSA